MKRFFVLLFVASLGLHVASASGGQGQCIAAREELHKAFKAIKKVRDRAEIYNDLVDTMKESDAYRLKADILDEKEIADKKVEDAFNAAEKACGE